MLSLFPLGLAYLRKVHEYCTEKYFPTISFRINDELKPRHAMLLVTNSQRTTTCGHVLARHTGYLRFAHFLQEKAVTTRQFKCYH